MYLVVTDVTFHKITHTGGLWLGSMANGNSADLQTGLMLNTQSKRLSHGQGGLHTVENLDIQMIRSKSME